jgi:cysteine desulfurase
VQAAGKIGMDFTFADYLTLSAHKIGGPQGVGALIVRDGAPFASFVMGGGQERGKRGGTENVPGIAGFGAAASIAGDLADITRQASLRDRFERELTRRFPKTTVFGARRLCNTSNFAIPGIAAETAIMALDLEGICVSSGAACSSGKVRPSHVLKAMGVADGVAASALRFSFGWDSHESDVDSALAALDRLASRAVAA